MKNTKNIKNVRSSSRVLVVVYGNRLSSLRLTSSALRKHVFSVLSFSAHTVHAAVVGQMWNTRLNATKGETKARKIFIFIYFIFIINDYDDEDYYIHDYY